jgi:hypothetical protein
MYLSNLTPLSVPPVRRASRPVRSEVDRRPQPAEDRRVVAHAQVTAIAERPSDDLRRAMDIDRPRYLASMISKAAAKGRGETAELPPLTGLAAQIVFQGKVRRGEVVVDAAVLPENPMARAVILSAKRARGEATAAEESWLSHFVKGTER